MKCNFKVTSESRLSIFLTAWVVSTSGFDVTNVDPHHPTLFALTNYTKRYRFSDFVSTSTVSTLYTARLCHFSFHGRHLDFQQNNTVDFVGDEKPTPENIGVDTKINMFLSSQIAEIGLDGGGVQTPHNLALSVTHSVRLSAS